MFDSIFIMAFLLALVSQSIAWLWQLKYKNADSVDITWAFSIGLIACFYMIKIEAPITNTLLIAIFPVIWYARLTLHLWVRLDKNHEDNRYQNLRAHWSENTQVKFLMFFILQAGLSFLFAMPAYWVLNAPAIPVPVLIFSITWGALCLLAVSVADWQLYQFKTKTSNKGKVCDRGLWAYSRHPNYFFEWLHWWVYPIVLFPSVYFFWATIVVFIILYFLLNLTGIPFSEQQSLKSRGDAYRAYQKSTNAFILWRKK